MLGRVKEGENKSTSQGLGKEHCSLKALNRDGFFTAMAAVKEGSFNGESKHQ